MVTKVAIMRSLKRYNFNSYFMDLSITTKIATKTIDTTKLGYLLFAMATVLYFKDPFCYEKLYDESLVKE